MKKKKALKVTLVILIILVALICGAVLFWFFAPSDMKKDVLKALTKQSVVRDVIATQVEDDYENNVQDEDFDKENVAVNEDVSKQLTGYQNIAIFGIDSRDSDFDNGVQSDTIIILSINNDTNAIRLASVYRDTYLNIIGSDGSDNGFDKVNSAYCLGGPQAAVNTLNLNLDLDITDYVVVNFEGLQDIIDLVGGISVNITDAEMESANNYIASLAKSTGCEDTPIASSGLVQLSGIQATAYCRIRDAVFYDEDGNEIHYDYGRTARQRVVLGKLVEKAKKLGATELLSVTKQILNLNTEEKTVLKTSLTYDQLMDLVPVAIDYNMEKNTGFPFTTLTPHTDGSDYVVAAGLSYNVSELHKFLFDDGAYDPSQTVLNISDYIKSDTGVPEVKIGE